MPKGRTNNAIRILVAPQFADHPCVVSWREAGHTVEAPCRHRDSDYHSSRLADLVSYDIILAPNAHFWNDMMWDMEAVAIAAGRRNKKARAK
jgi:hypothetical protein